MENERGVCCFCGGDCNPHSQSCGRCSRNLTYGLGSEILFPQISDEKKNEAEREAQREEEEAEREEEEAEREAEREEEEAEREAQREEEEAEREEEEAEEEKVEEPRNHPILYIPNNQAPNEDEKNIDEYYRRSRRRARSRDAGLEFVLDLPLDNIPFSYGIPCPEKDAIGVIESKSITIPCVICHINQIQTVNFPCMHACFCVECAKPALGYSNKCPQCRVELMHVSLLYLCYKEAEPSSKKLKSE